MHLATNGQHASADGHRIHGRINETDEDILVDSEEYATVAAATADLLQREHESSAATGTTTTTAAAENSESRRKPTIIWLATYRINVYRNCD